MEGDDGEPPARGQTVKDGVEALIQCIQLGVYGDADGLEGTARRVLCLAALSRGHSGGYDLRQLHRCGDGLFCAGGYDPAGDLPCVGFLAVVTQDAGQLLTVKGVDQIRGGGALLAHAHVKRCIGMIGEAARRIVQLMAGYTEV